ncbi:hypothetical protein N9N67_06130 [Bacteriovoracaceae bacterium]|nr:hypothetical protein [Bacteriovoracaceae bacterium]
METLKNNINGLDQVMFLEEAGHFVQEYRDIVTKKAMEYFNCSK